LAQYNPKKTLHQLQQSAINKLQDEPKLSLLQLGDSVRISLQTTKEYKMNIFRKKYLVQWSKEIYIIATITPASNFNTERYTLFDSKGVHINKKYSRYQLQHINKSNLIVNELVRPNFDKNLLSNFTNRIFTSNNNNKHPTIRKPTSKQIITRTQAQNAQNKPKTQQEIEKINKKYGLHNFIIDIGIRLPNQQNTLQQTNANVNNNTPNIVKVLSQQEIEEINKKYGLHNFTINVGIK